jgi:hypothetical protein
MYKTDGLTRPVYPDKAAEKQPFSFIRIINTACNAIKPQEFYKPLGFCF